MASRSVGPELRGMRCRFQSRSNAFSRRWSGTSTRTTRISSRRSGCRSWATQLPGDRARRAARRGGRGALIGGVASQILIIGVLGFALMFIGVLVAITPSSAPRRARPCRVSGRRAAPRDEAKPRGGFMDRLNERWDRRQEGRD